MTIEQIKKGESDTLEFKREFPDKEKKVLKTIAAFANCNGGTVVIGVDDETLEVVGVNEEDVFKIKDKIANSISDNIEPQIVPRISYERIEDKTIIIISISKGQNTPYCIRSEGLDGVYLRIGATTRLAERYAVQELSLLALNRTFDEVVQRGIDEAKQSEIDYLISAFSERSKKQVTVQNLVSWKLLKEDGGKLYPSVAFRLLASNDLHFAHIQCGLFKGTDKVHFLDRKEFDGSVLEQIENAITFLIQHLNIGAEIKGLYRRDIYEIPEEILRELVTNAVMHRNYLLNSYIQICIFDDRVEIVSPGGIFGGLTVEDILGGRSSIRNEVLADAFLKMRLVEHWGSGLKRIRELCAENGIEEPTYTASYSFFTATVRRGWDGQKDEVKRESSPNVPLNVPLNERDDPLNVPLTEAAVPLSEREKNILDSIQTNPRITAKEISDMLGVNEKTIKRDIAELKEKKIIVREGSKKTGFWKILAVDR